MSTNLIRTVTREDLARELAWLIQVGVDPPPAWGDPETGDRAMTAACEAYAEALAEDGLTVPALHAAVRAYARKPLGTAWRRQWPDVGMLIEAIPPLPWDRVDPLVRTALARFWRDEGSGLVINHPESLVQERIVRAIHAAGAMRRGDDDLVFVLRDVRRAYEGRS